MTGPEHYREAERLLEGKHFKIEGEPFHNPPSDRDIAAAQAHATLALVAATAMQAAVDGSEPGMSGEEGYAWYVVAGVKPSRVADDDPDDVISASDLREMDQADEAALDAEAGDR